MRKKNPTNYSKKTRKYVITFFFFFENGFLDFYLHFFFFLLFLRFISMTKTCLSRFESYANAVLSPHIEEMFIIFPMVVITSSLF